MTMRALAFAAIVCALCPAASHAGPCAQDITKAQLDIGKRLDQFAAQGKPGPESTFATMHRQPTPSTVAGAEQKLGDISDAQLQAVRQWMGEAKAYDDAGDTVNCEKALTQARTLLGL